MAVDFALAVLLLVVAVYVPDHAAGIHDEIWFTRTRGRSLWARGVFRIRDDATPAECASRCLAMNGGCMSFDFNRRARACFGRRAGDEVLAMGRRGGLHRSAGYDFYSTSTERMQRARELKQTESERTSSREDTNTPTVLDTRVVGAVSGRSTTTTTTTVDTPASTSARRPPTTTTTTTQSTTTTTTERPSTTTTTTEPSPPDSVFFGPDDEDNYDIVGEEVKFDEVAENPPVTTSAQPRTTTTTQPRTTTTTQPRPTTTTQPRTTTTQPWPTTTTQRRTTTTTQPRTTTTTTTPRTTTATQRFTTTAARSGENKKLCSATLGLGVDDQRVPDSAFTASSSFWPYYANVARLNNNNAWIPSKNAEGEYLQIDLGDDKKISSIGVQGFTSFFTAGRVTRYLVRYSSSAVDESWDGYDEDGFVPYKSARRDAQEIEGPTEPNEEARYVFEPTLTASRLRIFPVEWVGNIAMRIELYAEC